MATPVSCSPNQDANGSFLCVESGAKRDQRIPLWSCIQIIALLQQWPTTDSLEGLSLHSTGIRCSKWKLILLFTWGYDFLTLVLLEFLYFLWLPSLRLWPPHSHDFHLWPTWNILGVGGTQGAVRFLDWHNYHTHKLVQVECGKVSYPSPSQVTPYLSCMTDSRVAVARDARALCKSLERTLRSCGKVLAWLL